ncbi:uncharacterized protein LOC116018832 isoform X1 [Ipomoea triloba]|uniref:uncharacterized protein LOC116018832 isoform X1 n=1 Tax=Ipomoea triloba TaxID=35885 RepID=UPI00125E088B|nr:uncharacterized protein LOC116018832 isoform X1 [Ipomoea triloba]XP_031114700.1 uncharacterized protein LOC116018832 isoform X1 [Ipomoea triloba]
MGIPVALRLHCLKEIHRLLPLNHAGKSYRLLGGAGSLVPLSLSSSLQKSIGSIEKHDYESCDYRRYSTISKSKQESLPQHDLLSFIQSTINKHEGPSHCWLNGIALKKNFFKKEGITLVLVAEFFQGSSLSQHDLFIMLDKVKLLQQRYPFLPVMGYQYCTSPLLSKDGYTHLLRRVMKEYITFPILLSNKNFPKITGGTCCVIFRGLKSPIIYQGKEVDSMILDDVIKDLKVQDRKTANFMHNMNSPWEKPLEVFKEPYLCFPLRNLFLYFPGCISVDEKGNRVFVSDSNHHRIIVFDANGEILDCIGSSPGFEDGDFENAKLMRPAASFYHAADNCLYIADSENHAIRRADMERRILDTLYPATNSNMDSNSLWSWIFGKLWSRKDIEAKSDEFPPKTLLFPWHISKCQNDLFVLNRNLQTLWILDLASGALQEIVEGFSNISEICGHLILEKSNILKQIPNDLLKQLMHTDCSLEGIPYADLISSIATFQDDLIICNTVGQEVLKFNSKSGTLSPFQFSNFSILGLPYWFSFPMERVYATKDALSGLHVDHAELFNLLPGKVDIKLSIDIPESFELVEPLNESCIWRQARGAATVVSEAERISTSEKVCAAQQWYDELDHRTFWESEVESNKEVHNSTESSVEVLSSSPSEVVPEGKVLVDCCINTSPGTSEVIISAALYLKLRKTADTGMDSREQKAAKIADSLDPTRRVSKDLLVSYLLASKRDLEGLVVTRPLQVRLKFECPNHPTSEDNSKEIIMTDSSINVSVSLFNP